MPKGTLAQNGPTHRLGGGVMQAVRRGRYEGMPREKVDIMVEREYKGASGGAYLVVVPAAAR